MSLDSKPDPVKPEKDDSDGEVKSLSTKKEHKSPKDEQENFIDDIKSAAEEASLKNGFIYEPTSGLYYHTPTGYYYNAEYGLYYDGNTGKYYSYDETTKEFTYHSTVAAVETTPKEDPADVQLKSSTKKRKLKKKEPKQKTVKAEEDLEDGEISSEDSYVECSSEDEHIYEDISKHYPPSLRLIVQQSASDKLKVSYLI